jgi:hypothetical protein
MPMLQGEQAPGACPCASMKHVAPEIIHGVACFNLDAKNICQDNLAYVAYVVYVVVTPEDSFPFERELIMFERDTLNSKFFN